MPATAMQMLGIPAAWMTRCVALNAMPDQVDNRKATQCGLEICSTKVRSIRLLSNFCATHGLQKVGTWRLDWC